MSRAEARIAASSKVDGSSPTSLSAARGPRRRAASERLLVVDRGTRTISHHRVRALSTLLEPGDLLVVNDAATVPASLAARASTGEALELRLVARCDAADASRWTAVLLGEGSFRDDTDRRPPPPPLGIGASLAFEGHLRARITRVHEESPRLVDVAFDASGTALFGALYAAGDPIRYSYLRDTVPLAAFQTAFATHPWAVEMPSAARPLTARTVIELRRRGVRLASVTHAAGVSATGDPRIDAMLPLPERYRIPARTVTAIGHARAAGHRVVAVGTTVVRALEGAHLAGDGVLREGQGVTSLRIDPTHELAVVDALLTNVHAPGESHHELMRAFADDLLLRRAHDEARDAGYLAHEFGDATLIV